MFNFPLKINIGWLFVLLICLSSPIQAMRVQPLLLEINSNKNGAAATINVFNDGPNQLPLEITMEHLTLNFNGRSQVEPADESWLVFPPQVIIPPGGQQNFRLQWLGEPLLEKSQSFYVAVKQVPVVMKEGQSGIQLVYNIRALVNVAPPNSRSNLIVNKAEVITDKNQTARISVVLDNAAQRHAMFSDHELALELTDQKGKTFWSYELSSNEIFQTIGGGLVQPGKQRIFTLPINLPEQASETGVTVNASVKEKSS